MILVKIKEKQNSISNIEVTGHANSAKHGNDLICAGVSTVGVGILNTLDKFGYIPSDVKVEMEEGYINIEVFNSNNEIQLILETFVITLDTIEDSYPKNIKISRMEE